jgi:hypothetical protein
VTGFPRPSFAIAPSGEDVSVGECVFADGDRTIRMTVTAIIIRQAGVLCEVAWFHNGDAHVFALELWRLQLCDPQKRGGFSGD